MNKTATLFASAIFLCANALAAVWYVDKDNTGTEVGTSWSTAFNTIQEGIDAAYDDGGGEVWVAEGVYGSIVTAENVYLYGGFAGTEDRFDQRDWHAHGTIIDGGGQACCVVGADHATLDGFTIRNGTPGMENVACSPRVANCTFTNNSGAAMSNSNSSPTVTDCSFCDNHGNLDDWNEPNGAMFNSESSPTVVNCTFSGNTARSGAAMVNADGSPTLTGCTFMSNIGFSNGGAMVNFFSSPVLTDCTFMDNVATGGDSPMPGSGGAIWNDTYCFPTLTDCVFLRNTAELMGGAIATYDTCEATLVNCLFSENTAKKGGALAGDALFSPTLINCTLVGNSAEDAGAMYDQEFCFPTFINCILWSSAPNEIRTGSSSLYAITYSCVRGGV